jgi:type II secretory pathway component GspD/PulD (secretin)
MTEQINQESNSVETPKDATEVFTEMLDAQESNDKPEVENEEVATEAVEETDEEALEEEVDEESEEDEPEATEEEDESEEDDEVEVEERKTYRVKSGGEEKEVTLQELVSGYQKGDDYTKKSQALADQRKAVEAEAHAVNEAMQMREQYAQRLSQVQALLQQEGDDGVDLAELKENDPIQYAIKVAEKTENNKKLQLLQQEQNNLAQAQQHQVAQHRAKLVAHEASMLTEKVKEFSDPKKAEQLKGEIRNFGKSIGFTDNELAQVYDHRHVMVMQKAMEYDKLQKANPGVTKKLVKAPKMAKKGNKVANVDVYTKQKKRLKSSGKLTDAVDVFKNFI